MDPVVLYNVHHQEVFGIPISVYFYLTGLSAGSFILSTLSYVFGVKKYQPLGKPGVVLATVLLLVAPVMLLLHAGKPMRAWHLFVYINWTSPISWGSFLLTLYPLCCVVYGFFMFKGDEKKTRIFGIIGIPLAVMVHGYTGWILSFGKARALWNTALMPILFLVSAMVSGIALMIVVSLIRDRFFTKEKTVNTDVMDGLCNLLAVAIVIDIFLVLSDVTTLLISHADAQEVAHVLLFGHFALSFVLLENVIGKIVPLFIFAVPRWRKVPAVLVASLLVIAAIFLMRYNVVVGGENAPLM